MRNALRYTVKYYRDLEDFMVNNPSTTLLSFGIWCGILSGNFPIALFLGGVIFLQAFERLNGQ